MKKIDPYIIYAESIDTVGAAYGALNHFIHNHMLIISKLIPFPEPLPVTREMMSNMMMSGMNHGSMDHMSMEKTSTHQHKAMSDNMNMGGGMKMNHGMSMNHSMHMNMPTEPTIIRDTISPTNHLLQ